MHLHYVHQQGKEFAIGGISYLSRSKIESDLVSVSCDRLFLNKSFEQKYVLGRFIFILKEMDGCWV